MALLPPSEEINHPSPEEALMASPEAAAEQDKSESPQETPALPLQLYN